MNTTHFRLARPDDAAGILEIYAPYIVESVITFEVEVPGVEEFSSRVACVSGHFPYLVCESGSGLAGYAYASEHHERAAYQWNASLSIYMHPECKGRGLGRRLYGLLMEFLECLGYRNLYALISLPNEASVALQRVYGFREQGLLRKTGYKFGQWHDVAIWGKQIGEEGRKPLPPRSIQDLPASEIAGILAKWQPEA